METDELHKHLQTAENLMHTSRIVMRTAVSHAVFRLRDLDLDPYDLTELKRELQGWSITKQRWKT